MNHENTPEPAAHCGECLRGPAEDWGRSWVEVDLAALRRNAERVIQRLPTGGQLIISAKKDAYGHGLLAVVRALEGLPGFGAIGAATLEEGIALRAAGVTLPIICFSIFEGEALAEAIRQNLTISVTDLAEAQAADRMAARLGRHAQAHLKLDTGMGRLGRLAGEVLGEMAHLCQLPNIELEAVYSHLADAWADPDDARQQVGRMEDFRRAAGLEDRRCHWGGSDALGLGPELPTGTWLRCGIALYGDHPALPDLEPVMSFKSRVVYRRSVPAGTAISYGHTFQTTRPTELALVGAGYGNGLLRSLSGRGGEVLLHETRCPILGRVCMDQIVVDVTDVPGEVHSGEVATIFGRQGATILPASEMAQRADTISYELFCLAGQLNPRYYHGE